MVQQKWEKALGIGLLLAFANIAFGHGFRPVVAQVISFAFFLVMAGSIRRIPEPLRLPWLLILASAGFFVLAGVARFVHGTIIGVVAPFPSPADAFFYLGYVSLFAGEIVLIRRRTTEPAWDYLIDALIVAAAIGVVMWTSLLGAYVRTGGIPIFERSLTVGYSVLDLLLITATARLAVGPGARSAAWYLMAGAAIVILLSDLLATLQTIGSYNGDGIAMISCLPYVFFATASLHPSLDRLAEPTPDALQHLSRKRAAVLGCALTMSPAVVVYQLHTGGRVDLPVVMVGWIVLTLLVLLRLAVLIEAKEEDANRERVLREGSASLATSTGRHMMNRNTLHAVSRLTDDADDLRVSMALVVDRSLQVVDAVGDLAENAIGTAAQLASLPNDMAATLGRRTAVALSDTSPIDLGSSTDGGIRAVLVAPLVSRDELSGAIIITTARPLRRPVQRSIESLASTVSLALESAILTENLLRRKSERRFRALVENSSDIVLVVSDDQRITFVSPAAHRLLGFPDMTILGTHPGRWIHPADREVAGAMLSQAAPGHLDSAPLELRLRHADGEFRWFEIRTRYLSDDGEIDGLVVNAREITDRKATEELLATSEARFRALVQHSSDIVAVVGIDGRFSFVSPAITSVLGHRPADLVGTRAIDLLPRDEFLRLQQTHAMFVGHPLPAGTVSPPSMEVRLRGTDGDVAHRRHHRSPTSATSRRSVASSSTPVTSPSERNWSATCCSRLATMP